jgi:D-sedoheptulose 7-phosphate isomerase
VTGEPTGFLYPFIDAEEREPSNLLTVLASSARTKMVESGALRSAMLEHYSEKIGLAGEDMAARFRSGGRLLAFGNGGSATDAEGTVDLFRRPPTGTPLAAVSLLGDPAVTTALANDVGFDVVFSRQIIAVARTADIAIGFSTSGDSVNVMRAFEEAGRRRLLTVGLSGYDGGAMAQSKSVDHCFVVASDSVHRIQETQDAIVLALWRAVQRCLDGRSLT